MGINTKTPARLLEAPLDIQLPDWLEVADREFKNGNAEDLPTHILDLLLLHQRAIGGCMDSAAEIAQRYECGGVPIGPSLELAAQWHKAASDLGSASSALRLAKINEWTYLKSGGNCYRMTANDMAIKTIELVLEDSTTRRLTEDNSTAAAAALMLLDLDYPPNDGVDVIAQLLRSERLDGHPDRSVIEKKMRKIACKNGQDLLSLRVVEAEISESGDFKVGIYSALRSSLPLVPAPHDPEFILGQLNHEFPWFAAINEEVFKQLVVAGYCEKPAFKIRPLLLAGPPGCGKTTWTKRLAELTGVPMWPVMAAGESDSMFLRGTPRGWASARPGAVLQAMVSEETANPLFVIDELEKASDSDRNGRLWDTLLQLVEPATARNYLDECLQVTCDLSWVSWIATCNTLGRLPRPLLERFTVMLVEQPGEEHFDTLVAGVIRQFADELGLDERMLPAFDRVDLEVLRQCRSPREINRVGRMIIEDRLVHARRHASRM